MQIAYPVDLSGMRNDVGKIVRCFLIDVIVEPVAEQQIGVPAPAHDRLAAWIILRVIIARNLHIHSFGDIPIIFIF